MIQSSSSSRPSAPKGKSLTTDEWDEFTKHGALTNGEVNP